MRAELARFDGQSVAAQFFDGGFVQGDGVFGRRGP